MCNDFGNHIPYSAYVAAFSELRIPVRFGPPPNLEPREDIWPTDRAPIFRQTADGIDFIEARWGFPPSRPKAQVVINYRAEGRRFPASRCLVPVSHFFEFSGPAPKSKWKFTRTGADWFVLAGLWRPHPEFGATFTLLTTAPGADIAPIHHRQIIPLDPPHWSPWLTGAPIEPTALHPLPPGSLTVRQVR